MPGRAREGSLGTVKVPGGVTSVSPPASPVLTVLACSAVTIVSVSPAQPVSPHLVVAQLRAHTSPLSHCLTRSQSVRAQQTPASTPDSQLSGVREGGQ